MSKKTLGVLGGMGPLATAYFFKTVVNMTDAASDQEHIPMIVLNDVLIPDRTDYILDPSRPSPLPKLRDDVKKLDSWGADCIAIPCNTSHVFYETLCRETDVPIINIVDTTVSSICADGKAHTAAILATSGTLASGVYQDSCEKFGVKCFVPPNDINLSVMEMIYRQVKMGQPSDEAAFFAITDRLLSQGCDSIILGCTELSVIYEDIGRKRDCIFDSTGLLAKACVDFCSQ